MVDFGRQVGVENQTKIDPKRHRKSDEKKKVTEMAKKSVVRPRGAPRHRPPGFREGGRGKGKPFPGGKEGRV